MPRIARINGADRQRGFALLGAMVLALILSLLGATLLNLAGQEMISANVGREAAVAQQLADAAGELVIAWFHTPQTNPQSIFSVLKKKFQTIEGSASFFDQTGRSQFIGTADRPDLLLDATNLSDDQLLNDPASGMFRSMRSVGTIQQLKIYAPSKPGLLCTIDATVETQDPSSFRQSVSMQLGALNLPSLRAGVQVGQGLGLPQEGKESSVWVHWGAFNVGGDLVVRRIDEIPMLSTSAPITGQRYDETTSREDRWTEIWIGGGIQVTQPPPDQTTTSILPRNAHTQQNPIPGVRLDRWDYDLLKRVAIRHGSYYAIDKEGFLYPNGVVELGRGVSPDGVFRSQGVGDQRGLIFVDTLDQTAPRTDNLGTVKLNTAYLEGLVVVQGHVLLNPSAPGQPLAVLSPLTVDAGSAGAHVPVQLSGVHLNGVLYAVGNITINNAARVYGAVTAEGTITSTATGATLEVWHNDEMSWGLFRGLPVVFRAPGTWMPRY